MEGKREEMNKEGECGNISLACGRRERGSSAFGVHK